MFKNILFKDMPRDTRRYRGNAGRLVLTRNRLHTRKQIRQSCSDIGRFGTKTALFGIR